jgi:glycosyltransferase involved in cell wall biosynthesis
MRTAIVHPWFIALGGAERAVGVIADIYPDADIFTLFCDSNALPPQLINRNISTSRWNFLPGKYRFYRQLLPLYPFAFEAIDLRGYDVVITSDSCFIKGVLVDDDATHVCYCYSPMRCLYDEYHDYLDALPLLARPLFRWATHHIRMWDYIAAQRVTGFATISRHIARRIDSYYGQTSHVVYAPVDTSGGYIASSEDYYLCAGRLVRSQRLDIIIEACNNLRRRLIIAGSGRELDSLRKIAGPTVEFANRVSASELSSLYAKCRAVLFAAYEDFGIVPVEAQAYGRPVIAYGRGGALETIIPGVTGLHFMEQTPESLTEAILAFEADSESYDPVTIRTHAQSLDTALFAERFTRFVNLCVEAKRAGQHWTRIAATPPGVADERVLTDGAVGNIHQLTNPADAASSAKSYRASRCS